MKSQWIVIPIEIKQREFDSKLLLSLYAVNNGYNVILGHGSKIRRMSEFLPTGLVVDKSFQDFRYNAVNRNYLTKNRKYTSFDEEGLVFREGKEYVENRVSKRLLNNSKKIFCWGENQKGVILKNGYKQFADTISVTGHPRVDLWREEYRNFYKDQAKKYRKKYGKYIFVASNFARCNHYKGRKYQLQSAKSMGLLETESEKERYINSIKLRENIFEELVELIKRLHEKYQGHKIIIRPHPSENPENWERKLCNYERTKVIYEGVVTPWIMGSDVLIHNGCTTGIETFILDKIPISYEPLEESYIDNSSSLPNDISITCENVNEVENIINKALKQTPLNKMKKYKEKQRKLKHHIISINGKLASKRVIDEVGKISIKKDNMTVNGKMNRQLQKMKLKKIIKNFSHKLKLHKIFDSKRFVSWSYKLNKFPNTGLKELESKINRFQKINPEFKGINAEKIIDSVFVLS